MTTFFSPRFFGSGLISLAGALCAGLIGCSDDPAVTPPGSALNADGATGPAMHPAPVADAGRADGSAPPDAGSPPDAGAQPDLGAPAPSYAAGDWKGETSQAQSITFTFAGAGLQQFEFAWQLPGCSGTTKSTFETPLAVVNGTFTHPLVGGPGAVRGTLTGQFSNPRMLSGTIDITAVPIPGVPSCASSGRMMYTATPVN
jgi:hypothetical protein